MKKILFFICLLSAGRTMAQSAAPLQLSGYFETYYLYDFGQPADGNRPSFLYSHNRHNEVNLNLGFLKAAYQSERLRGNLALMSGTYANANLAAEPGTLQHVLEANAGLKLSQKHSLWLDAGIFSSHIGFESAIGADCATLTRSLAADNSPYYESGVKLSYTSRNEKWLLSTLLLNGWQRIQRPPGNSTPAFGHQLQWKPNSRVTLNSSSFIGNDKPDSLRQMRYFHNLYGLFQWNSRWAFTAGFDFGLEQSSKGSSNYNRWYTPVLLVQSTLNSHWKATLRGEYYRDSRGVIINTGTPNGFDCWGYSLNLDYQPLPGCLWRIEYRGLRSEEAIFSKEGRATRNNNSIATVLTFRF
jgi:hypothetical protein